jgi:hypothetical protein
MSTNQAEIVTAVLEYSPLLKKVFIRAVLKQGETLPKLDSDNLQNHVQVFLGADHGYGVGISPLIVEENAGGMAREESVACMVQNNSRHCAIEGRWRIPSDRCLACPARSERSSLGNAESKP